MLITRLIKILYQFYENIVKEPDEFMVYYYSISVHSIFLIFYIWGVLNFFGLLDLGKSKIDFFVIGIMILGINIYFFSKKRDKLTKKCKVHKFEKFDILDFFVLLYVLGSLLIFIGSMVYIKT